MRARVICSGVVTTFVCMGMSSALAQSGGDCRIGFTPLGDLNGGAVTSLARAISRDGTTIVGEAEGDAGTEAFFWTSESGMVGLGDLPGGAFRSMAYGVSDDGAVIVGSSHSHDGPGGFDYEAFRWEAGVMEPLGILSGYLAGTAWSVNADGSVIVGEDDKQPSPDITQAWIWTSDGGKVDICSVGSCHMHSVSADGGTLAGSMTRSGELNAIWSQAIGWTVLGDLPGGPSQGRASGISEHGSAVVGWSYSLNGLEAYLWRADTGMQALGDLAGGAFQSAGSAVAMEGELVIGDGATAFGVEAFIWDPDNGMQRLQDVLQFQLGFDIDDWHLSRATAITPDGCKIVGQGINPDGDNEAWLATLCCTPPSCTQPCSAAPSGLRRRAPIPDSEDLCPFMQRVQFCVQHSQDPCCQSE